MADGRWPPIPDGATIISQLRKLASEAPDRPAFVLYDKFMKRSVLSRQVLWERSGKFATVLREMGFGKGDIVCNTLVNSLERLVTNYGTAMAGAVSMHGQVLLADGEDIIKNWKDSNCKAVILDPNEKRGASVILERLKYTDPVTGQTSFKDLPNLSKIIHICLGDNDGDDNWLEILDSKSEIYVDDSVTEDDDAFVMTTSGSTGFSKLVSHTHGGILKIGTLACRNIGIDPESKYINQRSFGWIGGFPMFYPIQGATRIAFDQTFGQPDDVGKTLVRIMNAENCTVSLFLSSEIHCIMNALGAGESLSKHLETVSTGGGPLTKGTMAAVGRFTDSVKAMYGSSEIGLIFGLKVTDASTYENCCCGLTADFVQYKILGDDMKEVPLGKQGEIYIRSPTTTKGYMNLPEVNKTSFLEDGWFRTTDIGHVDEKGRLFVYCRKANVINHKGCKHYPGWMEVRINKHPDIQKATIVGVPHPINHEDICLCIIKEPHADKLSADDVKEFCKTLFITDDDDTITPMPQHYLFFHTFPVNSNAKFDKRALKAIVCERLGIEKT